MDMITKLPEMTDDALVNLRTNAKRLQLSGNPTQRTDAAALLPAVEAEIGARRLAKVQATRKAAGGRKKAAGGRKKATRKAAGGRKKATARKAAGGRKKAARGGRRKKA